MHRPSFVVLALVAPSTALAVPGYWVVDTFNDTPDVNNFDFVCADAAGDCSLRAAVDQANANADFDTIELGAGTYTVTMVGGPEDFNVVGDFDVHLFGGTDGLLIFGAGPGLTSVDGAQDDRVFDAFGPSPFTLMDLAVTNGRTLTDGGGVRGDADVTPMTLERVHVQKNDAGNDGGGVHASGPLFLDTCELRENRALNGSGGAVAMLTTGSSSGITYTTMDDNGARIHGGGLFAPAGMAANHSTFSRNTVLLGNGGGIALSGVGDLDNVTVSGNVASNGGGIALNAGNLDLNGVTVADNVANVGGGLVTNVGVILVQNSIVGQNAAGAGIDCSSGGGGIGFRFSLLHQPAGCGAVGFGGNVVGAAPMLDVLALNAGGITETHALLAGSPAINVADVATAPVDDQNATVRNNPPDMGACED